MPGILPMKMIRVGTTTQSRIAQACDRCRSKKIRCDGVRPCCTQCANVGFECKTSDKLSRRAFPRGYTESLEDRVRGLEAEVRELKALLDEKDEKIDVLSRIHNFSPQPRKVSTSLSDVLQVKAEEKPPRNEVILVEIPAAVHPASSSAGTSTTAALIEAFEEKAQESARSCPPILSSILLQPCHIASKSSACHSLTSISVTPPRLLSDQYINIFFQEWQPLLPILHRPTFLRIYEQYLTDPESASWQSNKQAVAQLFLIFEIAAHSSSSRTRPMTSGYGSQWRKALSGTSSIPTVVTLQCHILAQLCHLLKADYPHLLRHRAYAVSMVHQLNLHQGHKYHSLSVFEAETRKKVFWCQYVLDKFASAATGTPQLLYEIDVSAEYPADVDDENLSAQGISPALPGELTKMLSALALFRVSRILGKALEVLYPSRSSYQLSLTKLHSLSDELDQWQEELPSHLRLRFCNDKPATNLVSCRSPLMSLAYFYTRSLIHRPLLCYGTGNSSSAAMIVLAAAAKHELQILDLLDERSMNYTFPMNKQDMLLNAGFSILWQSIDLEEDSKLIKDNQKSLTVLLNKLMKENKTVGYEFRKIASVFVSLSGSRPSSTFSNVDACSTRSQGSMPAPVDTKSKSTRKQLQAIASRLSSLNGKVKNTDGARRASMSQSGLYQAGSPIARANSSVSLSSTRSAPLLQTPPSEIIGSTAYLNSASSINLDYFPLQEDTLGILSTSSSSTMLPPSKTSSITNNHLGWEQLVDEMGQCTPVVFDANSPPHLNDTIPNDGTPADWSSGFWQISPYELSISKAHVSHSLISFSEESMTSGDDHLFSTAGSHNGSTSTNETAGLTPPVPAACAESFKNLVTPAQEGFDFQDLVA